MKKYTICGCSGIIFLIFLFFRVPSFAQPLKVGVAGMNHDHVRGLFSQWKRGEVIILGIAEPDKQLIAKYKVSENLPDSIFYPNIESMLKHIKPDAVLAYNATIDHLAVVEAAAPMGIPVMVEKPLATTTKDALRMQSLANQYHIQVLTNYETTWYPSTQKIFAMIHHDHAIGEIRRMVVHDGHQGPKEIGCSPDFLLWLTDPVKNGGGALMDFGCYGANLMVWLMDGKAPSAVTAYARQIKPAIYPNVDDDATIILEFPGALGVVEASWNWPYGIKDLEIFGQTSYLHALNGKELRRRDSTDYFIVATDVPYYKDNLSYLADVIRGKREPGHDLSSLDNNIIVVKILEAARKSAKDGKKILL
jgi:predicted dehydrogenase